jgi:transcriptional regulator with XRE-family HTH domain
MDIRKIFAANVRYHRHALGLSQEAVAVRIGADRAYMSAIERGLQNVTLLSLHAIAEALEVRAQDLVDEDRAQTIIGHESESS